ncbi:hypothetical protein [Agromyces sp. NPDC058110]|uniref:hypothetical protein n=1 Tax=Agromyces sp. NPDC058110 TaxID=3346345 RepID=UPI0036DC056B
MTSSDRSELEARVAVLRRIVYGTPDGYASAAATELEAAEAELVRRDSASGAARMTAASGQGVPLLADAGAAGGAGMAGMAGAGGVAGSTGGAVGADGSGGLAVLEQLLHDVRDLPEAVDRAEPSTQAGLDVRAASAAEAPESAPPRGGARRRARVALAVAAVVAAVVAIGPLRELVEPPRGLAIFDRAPDPSQALMPGSHDILTPESLASVRYIGTEVGYRAWVFRDRGDVCMTLQRENWAGSGTTCVAEADFAGTGIHQVVRYEQLYDLVRPVGVGPGDGVEFAWTAESTGLEWSMRR